MKKTVLVPDYYDKFICKCGECRHTCCRGWGITVSVNEYFRLIGFDCDEKFRRKLDCAFSITDNPDENRYAYLKPDYFGNCPLIDEEGYCGLQRRYGEDAIPLICRVYPRSLKQGNPAELCVSGSCEKTIELLISDTKPLEFYMAEVDFPFEGIEPNMPDNDICREKRRLYMSIMSDRSFCVSERIRRIGTAISGQSSTKFICDEKTMLESLRDMIISFEQSNASMYEYGEKALESVGIGIGEIIDDQLQTAAEKYSEYKSQLYRKLPDIEIYIEKILVNHLYYSQFPYVMQSKTLINKIMPSHHNERSLTVDFSETDAYCSFVTAAALFRFVTVCCMHDSGNLNDFIDICAEVLRFLEHSGFYSLRKTKKIADCNEIFTMYEYIFN